MTRLEVHFLREIPPLSVSTVIVYFWHSLADLLNNSFSFLCPLVYPTLPTYYGIKGLPRFTFFHLLCIVLLVVHILVQVCSLLIGRWASGCSEAIGEDALIGWAAADRRACWRGHRRVSGRGGCFVDVSTPTIGVFCKAKCKQTLETGTHTIQQPTSL